jgi:hypothetical protein
LVRPGEDTHSFSRSFDPCPQDERHPNEEAQCIARPERTEFCLSPNRLWFGNAARTAPALAERISVLSDESVERTPRIAKWEPLSQCTDEPRGRESTRQTCNGTPADVDFAFGSDYVQLLQAFIHLESGIDL